MGHRSIGIYFLNVLNLGLVKSDFILKHIFKQESDRRE